MSYTKPLPEWEAAGSTPPSEKITSGWGVDEKPPADWFNWFFNTTYLALQELQQSAIHKDGSIGFNAAQGTAPFSVISTTKVANLNADKVDGFDFDQALKTTDAPTFKGITLNGVITTNGAVQDSSIPIDQVGATFVPYLGSPISGRIVFGDGSGWKFGFSRKTADDTYIDNFVVMDSGMVYTRNNTLDDGAGKSYFNGPLTMTPNGLANGVWSQGLYFNARNAAGATVQSSIGGDTDGALQLNNGTGNSGVKTKNNVLDDGKGNATFNNGFDERLVVNLNSGGFPDASTQMGSRLLFSVNGVENFELYDSVQSAGHLSSLDYFGIWSTFRGVTTFAIDANGILTLPYQSRLWAYKTTDQTITAGSYQKIIFEVENIAPNGEWNNSIFTAPEDGSYLINAKIYTSQAISAANRVYVTLGVDGNNGGYQIANLHGSGYGYHVYQGSIMMKLDKGHQVYLTLFCDQSFTVEGSQNTRFEIVKVA